MTAEPDAPVWQAAPTPVPADSLTVLVTDIERSTRLQRRLGATYPHVLRRHDELLDAAVVRFGGRFRHRTGDGVVAEFSAADDAVAAAREIQVRMADEPWPGRAAVRVRIGVHTGPADTAEALAAAVMAAGHGGQTLASGEFLAALRQIGEVALPTAELGEYHLGEAGDPVQLVQLGTGAHPAPRALPIAAHNLPRQLTRFVGRSQELRSLAAALANERLVTVVGPGGVGKTRMVFETVLRTATDWPGGCWVALMASAVPGESAVADRIARAVGATVSADIAPLQAVAERLGAQRALLVLDNAEHLLDDIAGAVRTLLVACPDLTVLVTSREPLRLAGEHVWRLSPLELPHDGEQPAGSDAVALFLDRAGLTDPDADDLAAVAAICRRLDGLPLAVELAAARAASTPLEALAQALTVDSGQPAASGDADARHNTLFATLQWSYDLLDAREQVLYRRLSVFRAPFGLDAAEAVTGTAPLSADDVLDLIAELLDKSMLSVADPDGDSLAYRMLALVRQHAASRLRAAGEELPALTAHLEWVVAALSAVPPQAQSHHSITAAVAAITTVYDDALAAFEHAVEVGAVDAAMLIASRLSRRTFMQGRYTEGYSLTGRALALTGPDDVVRGWVMFRHSQHCVMLDRFDDAEAVLARLLPLAHALDDADLVGSAWIQAGAAAFWAGRIELARERYDHALELAADPLDHHRLLRFLALCTPDDPDAVEQLRQVVAWSRQENNDFELARSLGSMGLVQWQQQDGAGEVLAGESVSLASAVSAHGVAISGMWLLAAFRLRAGDPLTARRMVERIRAYERAHAIAADALVDRTYRRLLGDWLDRIAALDVAATAD